MLQQLWLEGSKWDETVRPDVLTKWNLFVQKLNVISNISIPRWVTFTPLFNAQIHGFCDASEKAYCAVIYIRIDKGDSIHSHLLVSKTKVAPINPISLPRLELCGAVLLSQLAKHVLSQLALQNSELYLWGDSSITLGWLAKPPYTWKTYVANRVSKIIRNIGNCSWRHVRSHDNPADIGSRGCYPEDLVNNTLWWYGPDWLRDSPENWPKSLVSDEHLPDQTSIYRKIESFHTISEEEEILARFSRWDKAVRVIAYIMRFYKGLKKYDGPADLYISKAEFLEVKNLLIRLTQRKYYSKEIHWLEQSRPVHKRSTLYPLNPFLNNNGILRTNGRIIYSNLRRLPLLQAISYFCSRTTTSCGKQSYVTNHT
ncbi:uncharacterized protein LOC142224656 [Haematobia irritans]|uniref:uncharacterized protein LOC142224656 n=1 Tax=Haematobia irritans TaxID=7368 RepID=UPI003F4F7FA3